MGTLRLLVFATLFGPAVWGCELSVRDQVGLIQENESFPATPLTPRPRLPGVQVQCATLGPLTVVRAEGVKSFFVLDSRRVFYRWEETGAKLVSDDLDALRVYLSSYAAFDSWTLWQRYGLAPFESGKRPSLPIGSGLTWQPVQLIDRRQYEAALSANLKPEQVQFLQQAGSEQVRLYLLDNDYRDAVILEEHYGRVGPYSSDVSVTVRIRRGRKVEELELYLPINTAMAPFVGHVGPMGIPPIR
jgi:hypothetical protein